MTLLDIVTESRELRDLAAKEYARAVVRASDAGHSLREIARAAGLASHNTVRFILKRERRHEVIPGYIVYATTDNEMQAAAIARRLIEEEGRDATTADVADLPDVRSAFRYAVLAVPICGDLGHLAP